MIGQFIANGVLIGALYACLAVGFSLIWGVLNIVNMLHGSFVVLGAYLMMIGVETYGLPPLLMAAVAGTVLFLLGYATQRGLINKVVGQPILITLTLTFGLDLVLNNVMIQSFTANPRSLLLGYGSVTVVGVTLPLARLAAMALAAALTGVLYWLLRHSRIGRAIIAVRMDRHAAALLGIRIPQIYALTFGIGALMAGMAGTAMAVVFPITPMMSGLFLGKSFVICVIGGLGSVSGAALGGLVLGLIESFGALWVGAQWGQTIGFALMISILILRPAGLAGRVGFE